MENIGVMLVDDEVLAIEYLRNMVPWEEYGFSVVAEATDGKKALDRLEKHHPQVVFVDIRMPVMDGLEFCKRALAMSLDMPLIIILVTAYKDFDYAKQAIELGVHNYILKHDINRDTILRELKKARNALEKEDRKKSILRQNCFKDLIRGIKAEDRENGGFPADIGAESHFLILSQMDLPFPVMEDIGPGNDLSPVSGMGLNFPELPRNFSHIDHVDIDEKRFVTVIAAKGMCSRLETVNKLHETSRTLQKRFREKFNATISSAVSDRISNVDCFSAEYGKLLKILELGVFFGREKIFMFDSFPSRREPDEEGLAAGLRFVRNSLFDSKADEASAGMDKLFDAVHLCPGGLKRVCTELRLLHDEFAAKYNLEKLDAKVGRGIQTGSPFYIAGGLKEWFQKEFKMSIEKASAAGSYSYSRKTQQAISYIHRHYSEDISIEQVARELDISSVYLMKLFQKEVEETFVKHLTAYRMEIAKKLLADGKNKVYEISEMVGYKSSQYFSQVFRKFTGMNPFDYKEGEVTFETEH